MDLRTMRMDSEFENHLAEMKPFLQNLPLKSERQRCALWIQKLCEPVGSSTSRKNRNMYSKLLLRMLKRGNIEGPFATRPDSGPLKSLPSYLCVFLDETNSSSLRHHKDLNLSDSYVNESASANAPAWIRSELPKATHIDLPDGREDNIFQYESDSSTPRYRSLAANHLIPETRQDNYGMKEDRSRHQGKETEIKIKLLEAEFHEEKLNLQQKHDLALQKVLNRKNSEIDELKRHYKAKEKESDEAKRKLEKKVQSLTKDAQAERDAKDQQIEDLNSLVEETRQSLQAEFDSKFNDVMGEVEKEKYEMQKIHTQNIQDLLDDTNHRLTSMEEEYNSQSQATKIVISELEHHVTQLSQETESLANNRQILLTENQQIQSENSSLSSELKATVKKLDELKQRLASERDEFTTALRNTQSKHEANTEYLKQELKVATSRAQETIRDLEDQMQNLKHAIQDCDQQRTRELREKDSLHQKDVMSLQHLHEKQTHNLRSEWEQERMQQNRTIKTLEDTIRDKDDQIVKLTMTQKQCMADAEIAIETYKKQVSDAQQKVYADMRSQLEKMESDLDQSKSTREKLQQEFNKQIDELKESHSDELNECRLSLEHERNVIGQRYEGDRDKLVKDYEGQLCMAESRLRDALEQQEKIAEERRSQHQEVITGLEQQIRDLREELVSSNALRRQQLVELGLLREEERQKASRDHDVAIGKLEAEIDRQRIELHQQHAAEMERSAQKMRKKSEQMEEDYRQRLERAHERLMDAQNKESSSREIMIQCKNDAEEQLLSQVSRMEEEKNHFRAQQNALLMSAQTDLEKVREEQRLQQRHYQQVEFDLKNELSRTKLELEEKLKGLIPKSLKLDLEETIACLRSQVRSLQQRVEVLQDEDERSFSIPSDYTPIRLTTTSH